MDARIRILILDDEPIVGERLKDSLERDGFVVDALTSSHRAIQKLKEEDYDVLVTDLKMSPPDGLEVLRTAREIRPGIKSIVITGFATKDTARDAMQSGAVEFIAKPFKMSQLKKLIAEVMNIDGAPGK
jgi:DNA-binding NtrC family response regulator